MSTFVLESTGRSLGFFNSTRWIGATSRHYAVITDCAVAAESRGSGLGGLMIRRYLESLPGDTEVIVHCTKYARAMQATLKKLRFRRQPEAGRLECYRFVRPSSFAAASDAVPPTPRQGFGKLRAHR